MSILLHKTGKIHADESVKYHALYGYFYLGLSRANLAKIYNKHKSTISNWIVRFEDHGSMEKAKNKPIFRKFNQTLKDWLLELYKKDPVMFLSEAKKKFELKFHMTISEPTICRILQEAGLTWKVLEQRAKQIRQEEILFFYNELMSIDWDLSSLCFLDEVSFDNRGVIRNKGYSPKGQKLILRADFKRKARISLLCFLGQDGIEETFQTDGTFTRQKFFKACKSFALSGKVQSHPGKNSVWIMDGAKIHCHPSIIRYLRSLGIHPIFLPAYSPTLNPIEILFGLIKRELKKVLKLDTTDLELKVMETVSKFTTFDATAIYKKCSYIGCNKLDPDVLFENF